MRNLPHTSTYLPNLLRNLAAIIVTATVIGLTLMFSVVVFTFILVAGTIAWAYLWWKTRKLRKQMRDFPARGAAMESEVIEGEVIDGEVISVVVTHETKDLSANNRRAD